MSWLTLCHLWMWSPIVISTTATSQHWLASATTKIKQPQLSTSSPMLQECTALELKTTDTDIALRQPSLAQMLCWTPTRMHCMPMVSVRGRVLLMKISWPANSNRPWLLSDGFSVYLIAPGVRSMKCQGNLRLPDIKSSWILMRFVNERLVVRGTLIVNND